MNDKITIHIKLPLGTHTCPNCGRPTKKVHDYRVQKVNHLKWFERLTVLFYKRRHYVCSCGKRFSEPSPYVNRYQCFSKEWNQVVRIRSVKAKTLKEAYELKELYKEWQNDSKTEKDLAVVKAGLLAFYRKVEETLNPVF